MATQRKPRTGDYGADAFDWSVRQAAALRARRVDLLDWDNLAEEIESAGKAERRVLQWALLPVLLHPTKRDYRVGRRARSSTVSIGTHRVRAIRALAENPRLQPQLSEVLAEAYDDARRFAAIETDLPLDDLAAACPYDREEVTTRVIEWDGETA